MQFSSFVHLSDGRRNHNIEIVVSIPSRHPLLGRDDSGDACLVRAARLDVIDVLLKVLELLPRGREGHDLGASRTARRRRRRRRSHGDGEGTTSLVFWRNWRNILGA